MALPLTPGQEIVVDHGYFREYYQMASMQMATDHYNIGITLQVYSHLYPKESERAMTVLNDVKMN